MSPHARGREGESDGVVWAIPEGPATLQRPPPLDIGDKIPHPGCPRADKAPSKENPDPNSTNGQTVLEAHCAYWDADGDGIIYPKDTFLGFYKIGFNWFLSAIAVCVIHFTFSYWTLDSWIPDPRLPLHLKKIHRCTHGSDSKTYDPEGRFYPEHFEEIFSKYAKKYGDALTFPEILTMLNGNRNILDPVGWSAGFMEWGALYYIAADDEGRLSKERVRANYDGSLWYTLAREREQRLKHKQDRKQDAVTTTKQPRSEPQKSK